MHKPHNAAIIANMPRTYCDLRIRVPVDLHSRLKMLATLEHRSLNSLVNCLLREKVDGRTSITFTERTH